MESILKRSRRKFIKVKDLAEQYQTSERQIYRNLKMPEFEDCIAKFGTECIRVDEDLYFETCQKVFKNT